MDIYEALRGLVSSIEEGEQISLRGEAFGVAHLTVEVQESGKTYEAQSGPVTPKNAGAMLDKVRAEIIDQIAKDRNERT